MSGFERKIYGGFAAVVIIFVPVLAGGLLAMRGILENRNELLGRYVEHLTRAEQMQVDLLTQFSAVPAYVLSGDETLTARIEGAHRSFGDNATELRRSIRDPASILELDRLEELEARTHLQLAPAFKLRRQGVSPLQVHESFRRHSLSLTTEMRARIESLVKAQAFKLETAKQEANLLSRHLLQGLAIVMSVAFSSLLLIAFLLFRLVRAKSREDQQQVFLLKQQTLLSRMRKEAVEVVSHDLKNPLATLKMSLQILQEDLAPLGNGPADSKQMVAMALRSVEVMGGLIQSQLDHAKIEAGTLVLEKELCDFESLLRDHLCTLVPLAQAAGIGIKTEFLEVPALKCDKGRIGQVLSNLLGNAIKFTPTGGQIRLRAKGQEGGVVVSVEDTGCGIEESLLPFVFQRYCQAEATSSKGSGLGLAIAKALVEAHQGEIWIESVKGHGTKISFYLPRVQAPETEPLQKRSKGLPDLPQMSWTQTLFRMRNSVPAEIVRNRLAFIQNKTVG